MNTFTIGDKIERITGDKRNRGVIVEIDEASQRARISWTHSQQYTYKQNGHRFTTDWIGVFDEFKTKQPRTWAAFNSLKVIA